MSDQAAAVFRREGAFFVPTEHAVSPWGSDRLHGGPVIGLLARAVESSIPDPEMLTARFTFDLFRPVPRAPLEVRVEAVRQGGRLHLLQASLLAGSTPVARALALLLRQVTPVAGDGAGLASPPAGPQGIETTSLMRGVEDFPHPGFHTTVQTRWVPRGVGEPLAIWFRLPVSLVEDEEATPLQVAAALADFGNVVASLSASDTGRTPAFYINVDTTLYLTRRPQGEWFCLLEDRVEERAGISLAQMAHYDVEGCFGRSSQARLSQSLGR